MQDQNDLTGGVERYTLDLWLLPETQRQLVEITAAFNAEIAALLPDESKVQSSDYLRARLPGWIAEEYNRLHGEQREKEHGQ
jgi:hypothetical protein